MFNLNILYIKHYEKYQPEPTGLLLLRNDAYDHLVGYLIPLWNGLDFFC